MSKQYFFKSILDVLKDNGFLAAWEFLESEVFQNNWFAIVFIIYLGIVFEMVFIKICTSLQRKSALSEERTSDSEEVFYCCFEGSNSSLSMIHSDIKKIFLSHQHHPEKEDEPVRFSSNKLFSIMKTKNPNTLMYSSNYRWTKTSTVSQESETPEVASCSFVHLFLTRDQISLLEENVRNQISFKSKVTLKGKISFLLPKSQESLIQKQHSVHVDTLVQAQDSFPGQKTIRNQSFYEAKLTCQGQQFVYDQESIGSQHDTEAKCLVLPQDVKRNPFCSSMQESTRAQDVDRSLHLTDTSCSVEFQDLIETLESNKHLDEAQSYICFQDSNKIKESTQNQATRYKNSRHLVSAVMPYLVAKETPRLKSMKKKDQPQIASSKLRQYSPYDSLPLFPTIKKQKRKAVSSIALCLIYISRPVLPYIKKYSKRNLVKVVLGLMVCKDFFLKQNKSPDVEKHSIEKRRVSCNTVNIKRLHRNKKGLKNISPKGSLKLEQSLMDNTQRSATCSANWNDQESLKDPLPQAIKIDIAEFCVPSSKTTSGQHDLEYETFFNGIISRLMQKLISSFKMESNRRLKTMKMLKSSENSHLLVSSGEKVPISKPDIETSFPKGNIQNDFMKTALKSIDINSFFSLGTQKHGSCEQLECVKSEESTEDKILKEKIPSILNITEYGNQNYGISDSEEMECQPRSNIKNTQSDAFHSIPYSISELPALEMENRLKAKTDILRITGLSLLARRQEENPNEKKTNMEERYRFEMPQLLDKEEEAQETDLFCGGEEKVQAGEEGLQNSAVQHPSCLPLYLEESRQNTSDLELSCFAQGLLIDDQDAPHQIQNFPLGLQVQQTTKCVQSEAQQSGVGKRKNQEKEPEAKLQTPQTQITWGTCPCPTKGSSQDGNVKQCIETPRKRKSTDPKNPVAMLENIPIGEASRGTTKCGPPVGRDPRNIAGVAREKEVLNRALSKVVLGSFINHLLMSPYLKSQETQKLQDGVKGDEEADPTEVLQKSLNLRVNSDLKKKLKTKKELPQPTPSAEILTRPVCSDPTDSAEVENMKGCLMVENHFKASVDLPEQELDSFSETSDYCMPALPCSKVMTKKVRFLLTECNKGAKSIEEKPTHLPKFSTLAGKNSELNLKTSLEDKKQIEENKTLVTLDNRQGFLFDAYQKDHDLIKLHKEARQLQSTSIAVEQETHLTQTILHSVSCPILYQFPLENMESQDGLLPPKSEEAQMNEIVFSSDEQHDLPSDANDPKEQAGSIQKENTTSFHLSSFQEGEEEESEKRVFNKIQQFTFQSGQRKTSDLDRSKDQGSEKILFIIEKVISQANSTELQNRSSNTMEINGQQKKEEENTPKLSSVPHYVQHFKSGVLCGTNPGPCKLESEQSSPEGRNTWDLSCLVEKVKQEQSIRETILKSVSRYLTDFSQPLEFRDEKTMIPKHASLKAEQKLPVSQLPDITRYFTGSHCKVKQQKNEREKAELGENSATALLEPLDCYTTVLSDSESQVSENKMMLDPIHLTMKKKEPSISHMLNGKLASKHRKNRESHLETSMKLKGTELLHLFHYTDPGTHNNRLDLQWNITEETVNMEHRKVKPDFIGANVCNFIHSSPHLKSNQETVDEIISNNEGETQTHLLVKKKDRVREFNMGGVKNIKAILKTGKLSVSQHNGKHLPMLLNTIKQEGTRQGGEYPSGVKPTNMCPSFPLLSYSNLNSRIPEGEKSGIPRICLPPLTLQAFGSTRPTSSVESTNRGDLGNGIKSRHYFSHGKMENIPKMNDIMGLKCIVFKGNRTPFKRLLFGKEPQRINKENNKLMQKDKNNLDIWHKPHTYISSPYMEWDPAIREVHVQGIMRSSHPTVTLQDVVLATMGICEKPTNNIVSRMKKEDHVSQKDERTVEKTLEEISPLDSIAKETMSPITQGSELIKEKEKKMLRNPDKVEVMEETCASTSFPHYTEVDKRTNEEVIIVNTISSFLCPKLQYELKTPKITFLKSISDDRSTSVQNTNRHIILEYEREKISKSILGKKKTTATSRESQLAFQEQEKRKEKIKSEASVVLSNSTFVPTPSHVESYTQTRKSDFLIDLARSPLPKPSERKSFTAVKKTSNKSTQARIVDHVREVKSCQLQEEENINIQAEEDIEYTKDKGSKALFQHKPLKLQEHGRGDSTSGKYTRNSGKSKDEEELTLTTQSSDSLESDHELDMKEDDVQEITGCDISQAWLQTSFDAGRTLHAKSNGDDISEGVKRTQQHKPQNGDDGGEDTVAMSYLMYSKGAISKRQELGKSDNKVCTKSLVDCRLMNKMNKTEKMAHKCMDPKAKKSSRARRLNSRKMQWKIKELERMVQENKNDLVVGLKNICSTLVTLPHMGAQGLALGEPGERTELGPLLCSKHQEEKIRESGAKSGEVLTESSLPAFSISTRDLDNKGQEDSMFVHTKTAVQRISSVKERPPTEPISPSSLKDVQTEEEQKAQERKSSQERTAEENGKMLSAQMAWKSRTSQHPSVRHRTEMHLNIGGRKQRSCEDENQSCNKLQRKIYVSQPPLKNLNLDKGTQIDAGMLGIQRPSVQPIVLLTLSSREKTQAAEEKGDGGRKNEPCKFQKEKHEVNLRVKMQPNFPRGLPISQILDSKEFVLNIIEQKKNFPGDRDDQCVALTRTLISTPKEPTFYLDQRNRTDEVPAKTRACLPSAKSFSPLEDEAQDPLSKASPGSAKSCQHDETKKDLQSYYQINKMIHPWTGGSLDKTSITGSNIPSNMDNHVATPIRRGLPHERDAKTTLGSGLYLKFPLQHGKQMTLSTMTVDMGIAGLPLGPAYLEEGNERKKGENFRKDRSNTTKQKALPGKAPSRLIPQKERKKEPKAPNARQTIQPQKPSTKHGFVNHSQYPTIPHAPNCNDQEGRLTIVPMKRESTPQCLTMKIRNHPILQLLGNVEELEFHSIEPKEITLWDENGRPDTISPSEARSQAQSISERFTPEGEMNLQRHLECKAREICLSPIPGIVMQSRKQHALGPKEEAASPGVQGGSTPPHRRVCCLSVNRTDTIELNLTHQVLQMCPIEHRDKLLIHFARKTQEFQVKSFPSIVKASHSAARTQERKPSWNCLHPEAPDRTLLLFDEQSLHQIDLDLQYKYFRFLLRFPVPRSVPKPKVLPRHSLKLNTAVPCKNVHQQQASGGGLPPDREQAEKPFSFKNPNLQNSLWIRKSLRSLLGAASGPGGSRREQRDAAGLPAEKDRHGRVWFQESAPSLCPRPQKNAADVIKFQSLQPPEVFSSPKIVALEQSLSPNVQSSEESVVLEANSHLGEESKSILHKVQNGIPLEKAKMKKIKMETKTLDRDTLGPGRIWVCRHHSLTITPPHSESHRGRKHRLSSQRHPSGWAPDLSLTPREPSRKSPLSCPKEKRVRTTRNKTSCSLVPLTELNLKLHLARSQGRPPWSYESKDRKKAKTDLLKKHQGHQDHGHGRPRSPGERRRKKTGGYCEPGAPHHCSSRHKSARKSHPRTAHVCCESSRHPPFVYACIPADSLQIIPQTVRWTIPLHTLRKNNFRAPLVAKISRALWGPPRNVLESFLDPSRVVPPD
ncbi:leucine-rich repeat transmembrane protein CCDC168-like [Sorex fumeus]|uniref:leucine-rich repeat transmembrane protein CCDC168-like n=1 Tax=Sorex fumeus TaxID=62283 RepID=UPI0024AD7486|nr:leucine-rich repeat transmembrane protein CCDC168-like [Sorex fumeus]